MPRTRVSGLNLGEAEGAHPAGPCPLTDASYLRVKVGQCPVTGPLESTLLSHGQSSTLGQLLPSGRISFSKMRCRRELCALQEDMEGSGGPRIQDDTEGSGGPFWLTAESANGLQVLPTSGLVSSWGAGDGGAWGGESLWDRPQVGTRSSAAEPAGPPESRAPSPLGAPLHGKMPQMVKMDECGGGVSPESCVFLGNPSVWLPFGALEVPAGPRAQPDKVSIPGSADKDFHLDKTKPIVS